MSESIAEMVIPNTYIEVRSEGLIGVGGISTGNIGVVGTAAKGPLNTAMLLGSYADALDVFGAYDSAVQAAGAPDPLSLTRTIEQAFKGGAATVIAVRVGNGAPVQAQRVLRIDAATAAFTITAKEAGSYGNAITVGVVIEGPAGSPISKLSLRYRNLTETYEGSAEQIRVALASSSLVTASTTAAPAGNLQALDPAVALGVAGAGQALGDDKPNVTSADIKTGLDALVAQPVNILIVGNRAAGTPLDLKGAVGAHLEETENQGRERVAVLGVLGSASATNVASIASELTTVSNDRIVMVAPGLVYTDPGTGRAHNLPPSYLAASVAGKLASQAPHISLTNKELAVDGLDVIYGSAATKVLLDNRVLAVRPKFGFQVVKGITSDTGAFKQISVRRIVDYAKAGVRLGSDPYIGRLNNSRVRAALKATLDGFLSQLVLDEMLTEYELAVTATRSQEIAGICAVAMTLKPTFSIDYIRVTMTLQ
jgi:Phage tail sheath C-terminal domain